jgi:hypothetical protein
MKQEALKVFNKQDYVVIKDYLNEQTRNLLFNHTLLKRQVCRHVWKEKRDLFSSHLHGYPFGDGQVVGSFSHYSDPIFESLLYSSTNDMSDFTGKTLHPTYSYYRVYEPGAVMKKHVDRFSCKYSMTLCLGFTDKVWPMYVEGTPIYLEPGDLLVYRGDKLHHWRDPLPSGYQSQVFLHYVEEGAENWQRDRFDTRDLLLLDTRHKNWYEKGNLSEQEMIDFIKKSEDDYNKILNNR